MFHKAWTFTSYDCFRPFLCYWFRPRFGCIKFSASSVWSINIFNRFLFCVNINKILLHLPNPYALYRRKHALKNNLQDPLFSIFIHSREAEQALRLFFYTHWTFCLVPCGCLNALMQCLAMCFTFNPCYNLISAILNLKISNCIIVPFVLLFWLCVSLSDERMT